jgi:hypothetical protein
MDITLINILGFFFKKKKRRNHFSSLQRSGRNYLLIETAQGDTCSSKISFINSDHQETLSASHRCIANCPKTSEIQKMYYSLRLCGLLELHQAPYLSLVFIRSLWLHLREQSAWAERAKMASHVTYPLSTWPLIQYSSSLQHEKDSELLRGRFST